MIRYNVIMLIRLYCLSNINCLHFVFVIRNVYMFFTSIMKIGRQKFDLVMTKWPVASIYACGCFVQRKKSLWLSYSCWNIQFCLAREGREHPKCVACLFQYPTAMTGCFLSLSTRDARLSSVDLWPRLSTFWNLTGCCMSFVHHELPILVQHAIVIINMQSWTFTGFYSLLPDWCFIKFDTKQS